jgi:hypothetical protein
MHVQQFINATDAHRTVFKDIVFYIVVGNQCIVWSSHSAIVLYVVVGNRCIVRSSRRRSRLVKNNCPVVPCRFILGRYTEHRTLFPSRQNILRIRSSQPPCLLHVATRRYTSDSISTDRQCVGVELRRHGNGMMVR